LIRSLRTFTGVDPKGINRETAAILEGAAHIRLRKKPSLSISKAALILHAKYLSTLKGAAHDDRDMALATGILTALRFLVYEDTRGFEKDVHAPSRQLRSSGDKAVASPVASPSKEDEHPCEGDYVCKACTQELFNTYLQSPKKFLCRQCYSNLPPFRRKISRSGNDFLTTVPWRDFWKMYRPW
jgi:hypothetical protein